MGAERKRDSVRMKAKRYKREGKRNREGYWRLRGRYSRIELRVYQGEKRFERDRKERIEREGRMQ